MMWWRWKKMVNNGPFSTKKSCLKNFDFGKITFGLNFKVFPKYDPWFTLTSWSNDTSMREEKAAGCNVTCVSKMTTFCRYTFGFSSASITEHSITNKIIKNAIHTPHSSVLFSYVTRFADEIPRLKIEVTSLDVKTRLEMPRSQTAHANKKDSAPFNTNIHVNRWRDWKKVRGQKLCRGISPQAPSCPKKNRYQFREGFNSKG